MKPNRVAFCGAVVLPLFFLASCGDDPGPGPEPEPDPLPSDVPEIPSMRDPNQDPPMESATLTTVRPLKGSYAPISANARCTWDIDGEAWYEELAGGWIDCTAPDTKLHQGVQWNHLLPPFVGDWKKCNLVATYHSTGFPLAGDELVGRRFVLMKDGSLDLNPNMVEWTTPEVNECYRNDWLLGCLSRIHRKVHYRATPFALSKDNVPHLRRERFWECTPWPDNAMVKRMQGASENWVSYEYTKGSSKTETESFAWTLGAEVGAAYEGLGAKISASITNTFTQSATVSESATVKNDYHLVGEDGKLSCYVLWVLVERFTVVGPDGKPYTDPNYEFSPAFEDEVRGTTYDFEIRGSQTQVAKYMFDAPAPAEEVEVAAAE